MQSAHIAAFLLHQHLVQIANISVFKIFIFAYHLVAYDFQHKRDT